MNVKKNPLVIICCYLHLFIYTELEFCLAAIEEAVATMVMSVYIENEGNNQMTIMNDEKNQNVLYFIFSNFY